MPNSSAVNDRMVHTMASCIATFHDYFIQFLSAINSSDVPNPTIYKVKGNEIWIFVPVAQQDSAGGLKHCGVGPVL